MMVRRVDEVAHVGFVGVQVEADQRAQEARAGCESWFMRLRPLLVRLIGSPIALNTRSICLSIRRGR